MTSKVQAAPGFTTHEADGISVVFDPQGGIISDMIIATDGGGELRPLHPDDVSVLVTRPDELDRRELLARETT